MGVMKLFEKILIANRGEIACRIIRSTRKLGIATVCIYAAPDESSLHVSLADEAYGLGEGEIRETYLNIEKILEIARISKCDAIHPGYGFLSENPEFAAACEKAGIVFIGPSSESIRLMGNKIRAREFAQKAGIPVTAGMTGDPATLLRGSSKLPFPLLIKAAAGGGGKGMRVVKNQKDFADALESTSREAASYFGDGTVYIEQFIEDPRHIEVQVMGDHFGNVIHLFERECSIQRRYQKIVEESPSPTLTPEVRKQICESAVKITKANGYRNAGTIEFLVDKNLNFYFLEMNTRVQVEHPVTEMVTGIDIVEEQLLIASGNSLRINQEELSQKGHAIECRIYAEDPENNFMPSPGQITLYAEPSGKDIRLDTGIAGLTMIRSFYDPMIAKLIVWGDDRNLARQRMIRSLNHYIIHGIRTNIPYLNALLQSNSFIENKISTRFCDTHTDRILQDISVAKGSVPVEIPLLSYLVFSLTYHQMCDVSLWECIGFWRIKNELKVKMDGKEYLLELLHRIGNHFHFRLEGKDYKVSLIRNENGKIELMINGNHFVSHASVDYRQVTQVSHEGSSFTCERGDILVEQEIFSLAGYGSSSSDQRICSPMPGKVVKVNVKPGDTVAKGDLLLVVEAMKMENNIISPKDGEVEIVNFKQGDMVDPATELVKFKMEN
jgi:3-methylcrotonyl-CoA carboxylase alpha subunit